MLIHHVVAHCASDPPVLCQILCKPQTNRVNRSPRLVRELHPQIGPYALGKLIVSIRLSLWNQSPFRLVELMNFPILSGCIQDCKLKKIEGRDVLPRISKRRFH